MGTYSIQTSRKTFCFLFSNFLISSFCVVRPALSCSCTPSRYSSTSTCCPRSSLWSLSNPAANLAVRNKNINNNNSSSTDNNNNNNINNNVIIIIIIIIIIINNYKVVHLICQNGLLVKIMKKKRRKYVQSGTELFNGESPLWFLTELFPLYF